jgi:hypothetical protein
MSLPPVTDVAKVELIAQLGGHEVVNIFHVHNTGGWDTPTLTDLQTLFATWLVEEYSPPLSNEVSWTDIISTDLGVADGAQVSGALSQDGGYADTSLPANVALVASWRTGYSGRSFRGRTFLFGIPSARQESPQKVTSAFASAIQGVMAALLDRLADASQELVVVSYFHDSAPRVTPIATTITNVLVNTQLDTQRRRLKQ